MTYYDSAENATITHKRALEELEIHGVPGSELDAFYAECGYLNEYKAQDVLNWLGY